MELTLLKAELRVAPKWSQVWSEDGPYDYQSGWIIEGRVPAELGDAVFTYQRKVFGMDQEEQAEAEISCLCGNVSNGYWANIQVSENDGRDSGDWMLTGCSY